MPSKKLKWKHIVLPSHCYPCLVCGFVFVARAGSFLTLRKKGYRAPFCRCGPSGALAKAGIAVGPKPI